ncbi:threonine synthase [Candidatus Margulisiibacteriota bacterium]
MYKGLIAKYRKFLPVSKKTPRITLNEGNTPLIPLVNLPKEIGLKAKVYAKFEGANPTGSFKDRGMTMAVSKAVEEGSKVVMCASTGNTSASAAAYAARTGIDCAVIIPEKATALGKLSQALMHGAKVFALQGNFDEALKIVLEITNKYPVTLVNSLNPYRLEGQKTGAFEIIDELKEAPDYHFIPVGNAGNITAYWMGYKAYHMVEKCKKLPKMVGWQAAGAAPIVEKRIIENPQTVATAIKIGNPASWKMAESARDESGGIIDKVTDEEITEAQKMIASLDGIFCEPASAASIAGIIKSHKNGIYNFTSDDTIVAILTGNGLKDPERAVEISEKPIVIENDVQAVVSQLGLG